MKKRRDFLFSLCLLAVSATASSAGEPLQLGVFPYLPPR
jgi:hypothetical protein